MTVLFEQAVTKASTYLMAAEGETDLAKAELFVRIAESYTALATLLAEYETAD